MSKTQTLDEIEVTAMIARMSKWQVAIDPTDVLRLVLYIRHAEDYLSARNPELADDFCKTRRELGLK